MLRVVYSNRSGELARALCEALPAPGDPFARTHVVVPGRLVSRWVQYAVAERRGVAAQLDLRFLETFLADSFTRDAAAREAGLAALDRPRFEAVLASVLADDDLVAAPGLGRVADYLADDDLGARAVRRVQLAGRLATLLWDYSLTRPEWLDAWEAGRAIDVDDADGAAWQATIWRAALARLASIEHRRWVPVPRLPRVRRRLGMTAPVPAAPIHVVGFSYLARAYLDALEDLAQGGDVTIYQLNPCAEYWEDVPDRVRPRTSAKRRVARDAGTEVSSDPPALRLWGRPARDTVAALVDRTAGDFDARFVDPGEPTALHAMLRDVLARAPVSAGRVEAPTGVTVLACPSLTRELEIIGGEITRLLRADPTLRASDIRVLVAGSQAERYLAQLPAIFSTAGDGLPFHVVDLPLAEHGRVAEGALLLLELPLGRFTRPELLGLMTHPAVLARHPHVDADDWVRWAERLGIVHGASRDDHVGTYLADEDLFHWDQGVRRLALGAFMAGARSGDDTEAHVGDARCLPEEIAPDLQASAATFALLARSLIADATWLRSQRRTLTEWAEILETLIASYLGAAGEQAARELARVRRELACLRERDMDGRLVGYPEVVEVARHRLGAMRGDRGEPLADGVMVAPLAPMRPLPARVVFCVGLAEGRFPAGDAPSPLDLRSDVRRGDVPLRDRDRYAFFEALLAASDQVFLSYVALDAKSGEVLAPSSVVIELADAMAPYLGLPSAPEALAAMTAVHPLRRWSADYGRVAGLTPPLAPTVGRERWAAVTRERLVEQLRRTRGAVPEPGELRAWLTGESHAVLRTALGLDVTDGAPGLPPPDEGAAIPLSLGTLRRFLESPLQAWAQAVLRLDDGDDEDLVRREDEPFGTDAAVRAGLLREAFARHLGATGDPPAAIDAAYDAALRRRRLAGHAPVGVFGDAERQRDIETLRDWSGHLSAERTWRRIAFGRASAPGCELRPPLVVDVELAGRPRRVELTGMTELFGAQVGSVILSPSSVQSRHDLRGAVDHLALAAAGLAPNGHRHVVLGRTEKAEIDHAPWPPGEAMAHLAVLAGDLLGERHAYLMSLKIARDVFDGKHPRLERARDEQQRGTLGFGPIGRAEDLDLPSDWRRMVARRWQPILERMSTPGQKKDGNGKRGKKS